MRWVISLLAASLAASLATSTALAQDPGLLAAERVARTSNWPAIGRLEMPDGICTGTLIREALVLTTAHCFFDSNGRAIRVGSIRFLSRDADDDAVLSFAVSQVLTLPEYRPKVEVDDANVAVDLALALLVLPSNGPRIDPIEVGQSGTAGAELTLVSQSQDTSDPENLVVDCVNLSQQGPILYASCAKFQGVSGAAIMQLEEGETRLISLMSAISQMDGVTLTKSMELGEAFDRLMAMAPAAAMNPALRRKVPSLTEQLGRAPGAGGGLPQIGK